MAYFLVFLFVFYVVGREFSTRLGQKKKGLVEFQESCSRVSNAFGSRIVESDGVRGGWWKNLFDGRVVV